MMFSKLASFSILLFFFCHQGFAQIVDEPQFSSGFFDETYHENRVLAFGSAGHTNVNMFNKAIDFLER
jgi:hypothetical protein